MIIPAILFPFLTVLFICCLKFWSLSTKTPMSFSTTIHSSSLPSIEYLHFELFFPTCKTLHLSYWIWSASELSTAPAGPCCFVENFYVHQTACQRTLVLLAKVLMKHPWISGISLIKKKKKEKKVRPRTSPGEYLSSLTQSSEYLATTSTCWACHNLLST